MWVADESIDGLEKIPSLPKRCELVGLAKSTYYYQPLPISSLYLELMEQIDKIYTAHPDKGKRRICQDLQKMNYNIGVDLVRTLMRMMGIEAIYPKPNLSKRHHEHKVYPYLLRGVKIDHPNQVWSTDITYIPMKNGFLYLTAVIDWFSRYVLSWRLSNTLDGAFCREALLEALSMGRPGVFNTDQGAQYTSTEFTSILLDAGIAISMDGRGRAIDNVFIERIWRTVKYEDIYLKAYECGKQLYHGMKIYWPYYNNERLHSSLGYKTPRAIYWG